MREDNHEQSEEAIIGALQVLLDGGVILYPTDTLYGLGARAFDSDAVDRVYAIKGRDEGKPILALCSDVQMVEKYADLTPLAARLSETFWPGALTMILPKRDGVEGGIARGHQTVAFRIPGDAWCRDLVSRLGEPITATSANVSGEVVLSTPEDILNQLGHRREGIGYIVDIGRIDRTLPSTVVDLTGERPIITRVGALSEADIWAAIVPGEEM